MPKLTDLDVRSMGVVDKAANKSEFLLKSEKADDQGYHTVSIPMRILKADLSKGIAYGLVYEANTVDAQGDWTDEATIENAAHTFLEQGRQREVDINHDGRLGKGVVVESTMIYGEHPNYPTVKNAAWVMAIKLGPEALLRAQDGELTGFSLEGRAKLDFSATPPASKSAPTKPLIKAVRRPSFKIKQ
jgi:hypothetical protein